MTPKDLHARCKALVAEFTTVQCFEFTFFLILASNFSTAGPVRIEGKKFEVGTKSPTDGSWRLGDIIWNSNPQPSGYVGWICVREGTPGIWKPFAQIGS